VVSGIIFKAHQKALDVTIVVAADILTACLYNMLVMVEIMLR
jgi:hypothetical protein